MELMQVAVKICNKPVNRLLHFIMSRESSEHAADRQTKEPFSRKKGTIAICRSDSGYHIYSDRLNLPLLQTATNFGFWVIADYKKNAAYEDIT
jgi:hypothetical protein